MAGGLSGAAIQRSECNGVLIISSIGELFVRNSAPRGLYQRKADPGDIQGYDPSARPHESFDRRQVVRGLSFTAPDGAITGLLGANGAGKTTTLRMICGVLQPDSGAVTIDGATTEDPRARQSRLGALLDHMGVYPRLTVRENLAYFGMLRGVPPAVLSERSNHVITSLGLEGIADRRTAGFSQGERMKTALGRAILHAPKNLLLDEPTNGLDVPTVRSLRDRLRRLRDA